MLCPRTALKRSERSREDARTSPPSTRGARYSAEHVPRRLGGLVAVVRIRRPRRIRRSRSTPSPSTVTSMKRALVRCARSWFRRNGRAEGAAVAARSSIFMAGVSATDHITAQIPASREGRASSLAALAGLLGTAAILRRTLDFRHIAIEGPIGVGQVALAERLGARLDATVVLEDTDNPFLADFYADRPGRRVSGAALLPAQPPPAAGDAPPGRSLQPDRRSATTSSRRTRSTRI